MAAIAIGVLLVCVAGILVVSNVSLLIGRSIPRIAQKLIHDEIEAMPGVVRVVELLTLQLGPSSVLVAAKVDFSDTASGAAIEAVCEAADRRLRARFPTLDYVFLDPTPTRRSLP